MNDDNGGVIPSWIMKKNKQGGILNA